MEKLLTSHQAAKLLNVWPHTLVQKYIKKKERFPELSNWKQWSAIKKAAVSAIKKLIKQEVKSLVSWQHYRKQLLS